jgi:hypothetical protein
MRKIINNLNFGMRAPNFSQVLVVTETVSLTRVDLQERIDLLFTINHAVQLSLLWRTDVLDVVVNGTTQMV